MPFFSTGFTLIELLVVISIVSLLSAVVFSSLNSARAKARDAKRLADLMQIRNALILYADDHSGNYPTSYSSSVPWSAAFTTDLAPYLKSLATDPLPFDATNNINYYAYWGSIPASWTWDAQFSNPSYPSCTGKLVLWAYTTEHTKRRVECNGPDINFVLE